ncbi:MAG: M23 family metallopeptidase [Ruminococcaceae bacterium]|nr:M23 family metallopeptidase [Oscillospiraceae bacterium]
MNETENKEKQQEILSGKAVAAPSDAKKQKLSRKEKKALLKLYRRGKVSDEYLFSRGISEWDFSYFYQCSRKNGLSFKDSFYNAAYVSSLHRFDQSKKTVSKELENTYSHPKGWYGDSTNDWKGNIWSRLCAFLGALPVLSAKVKKIFKKRIKKIRKGISRGTSHMDRSYKVYINFFRVLKKLLSVAIPVACFVLFINYATDKVDNAASLGIYVNGELVGSVKSEAELIEAKEQIEIGFTKELGEPFYFSDQITFSFVSGAKVDFLTRAELIKALNDAARDHVRPGFGIYIDGHLVAACENHSVIEAVMTDLETHAGKTVGVSDDDEITVAWANDITVESRNFNVANFMTEEEIRVILGLDLSVGEDVKTISARDLYYQDIARIKNRIAARTATVVVTDDDKVTIDGQGQNVPLTNGGDSSEITLGYLITRLETAEEVVPYETIEIETENFLAGSRKVDTFGKDGKRIATYAVTYDKDGEVERELVSEEILKEAQPKIIYIGTRIPTEEEMRTTATGTFIMPYNNYLSSSYGIRNVREFGTREFHNAWDIPGPYGANILASDGGIVSHVGYTSGYGNHVIIDHENGYETVYAHLSRATVKKGQRVGQKEVIGKMGASGRVTGVHVHFEIRKDGTSIDPELFLGKVEERY